MSIIFDSFDLVGGVYVAKVVTPAMLRDHAFAKVQALLSAPRDYAPDVGVGVKSNASGATIAHLGALLAWGTLNPTLTTSWIEDDGAVVVLTGVQGADLAALVLTYLQSVYGVLADAMTSIASGVVATTAQIDALAWPT